MTPTQAPRATEITQVDGLPVMTVGAAQAAWAAGKLPAGRAAIRGYWSDASVVHSCYMSHQALWWRCHEGEFGITELDEPILTLDAHGMGVSTATGPHLTPEFDPDDRKVVALLTLPLINGQRYPPVPILVVGHFGDPSAEECPPEARPACRDRFFIDRIVDFDPGAAATPAMTPPPTPFPSPWPPGLFEAGECAGNVPYAFVGWTTFEELGIKLPGYGHIWAVVSRETADRSGGEWSEHVSGHRYRHWARVVCYRPEWMDSGVMGYVSLPGTEEIHWEDGVVTPGVDPHRPGPTAVVQPHQPGIDP
jgi:hypothetical protein